MRSPLPAQERSNPLVGIGRMSLKAAVAAFLLFVVLGPLAGLVIWSFTITWFWPSVLPTEWGLKYWGFVGNSGMMKALTTGVLIAVTVTLLCLLIATPLSYLLARVKIPFKPLILLLFLLPQAFPQLPVFANTAAILYRFNMGGKVSGVIMIHLVGALVFAVWTLTAVFKSIPVSLEEAAINLGASRTRAFLTVALPLALPGLIASSVLVFLWSLDEFTGTLLVGAPFVQTLPTFMYAAAQGYELQVASITAILLMVPGIVMLALMERYLKSEYLSKFGGA
ncbi:MAG TPA: ABC transporter permease subunit [Symbiobacteriaceae bacterium]|nr:ABC transporter permease subunit [Symbiobacteriaceae bacterium]